MPPKATDILSYKGDPGLAGGRGVVTPDFSELTQSARDFALSSFRSNQQLYQQRIQDRDKLFGMIEDESLIPNNILEQDRPEIDKKSDLISKIYFKYGGDITKDPAKYREFTKALSDAKAAIKQAQKKYVGVQADTEALKQVTGVEERRKREQHIASQIAKPYTELYQPYVPIIDFKVENVQPAPLYSTKVVGLNDVKTIDPNATFGEYRRKWSDDNVRQEFENFVDKINFDPNPKERLDKWNEKLKEMKAAGVNVEPIQAQVINGKVMFTDPSWQVAAKIRMAEEPNWTSTSLNKELSDRQIDQSRLALTKRGQDLEASRYANAETNDMLQAGFEIVDGKWKFKGLPTQTTAGVTPKVSDYWNSIISPQLTGLKLKGDKAIPSNYTGDIKVPKDQISGLSIALSGEKKEKSDIGYGDVEKVSIRYKNGVPVGVVMDEVFYDSNNVNSKAILIDNKSVTNKLDRPDVTVPVQTSKADDQLTDAEYYMKYKKAKPKN